MVSLGIPRSLKESGIRALAEGFRDAMAEWELHLVGGDTNEADDVIIDCVLAGFADRVVDEERGLLPASLWWSRGSSGRPRRG